MLSNTTEAIIVIAVLLLVSAFGIKYWKRTRRKEYRWIFFASNTAIVIAVGHYAADDKLHSQVNIAINLVSIVLLLGAVVALLYAGFRLIKNHN
jgi:hypothetical protein